MSQLALLLGLVQISLTSAGQCDVAYRTDCGYVGIDQGSCERKDCCWRPGESGIPWCFNKASAPSPPRSECSLKNTVTDPPFSSADVAKIRAHFLANIDIDGSGAVVAAPDHNTGPGGDYYFHWERDGALSMDALLRTSANLSDISDHMQHYVNWVSRTQNQPDPHGIDIRTEPKYTIPDGRPFAGSWCRPQNDGPGLRGRTLAEYAIALLNLDNEEYVTKYLWTRNGQLHGGLVKNDLDWVAENWQSNGCDLWEEIQSDNFFWNRYVDRASLDAGERLAERMGDTDTAQRYRIAKINIEKTLMGHYNGDFVFESQSRKKDAAVIEAFNVGDLSDGLFGPLSKEVLGTVITLNALFCSSFTVNQRNAAAGKPGILYGRYEGDTYDGGNPWVLLSATLSQLIYRQAAAALDGAVKPGSTTYALLQKAYGIEADLSGKDLGDALLGSGDAVLFRIRDSVGPNTDFHMAEQLLRDSGAPSSAKDLTWNYADVLKAMHARDHYVRHSSELATQTILV